MEKALLINTLLQACVKSCLDISGILLSTDGDPASDHHQAEVPGGPAGQGGGQAQVGASENEKYLIIFSSLTLLPNSRRILHTTTIKGCGTLLIEQDFLFHVSKLIIFTSKITTSTQLHSAEKAIASPK